MLVTATAAVTSIAASPANAAASCRIGTSSTRGASATVYLCAEDGDTYGDYYLYDTSVDGRRAELWFNFNGSSYKFDEVLTGGGTDTGNVTFIIGTTGVRFRACTSNANANRVCDSWR